MQDVSNEKMKIIKLIEKKSNYVKELQEMNKLCITGCFIDELKNMIKEIDIKIKKCYI